MNPTRRELNLLLPFLLGQQSGAPQALSTEIYHPDQSSGLAGREKKGSRIFFGTDHSGFQLEMHETILGPRIESHPPHKHVHEEIIIVLEGTVETYVEGKTDQADRGAVIYFESNQLHKLRNARDVPTRYYVLELRGRVS